MRLRKRLFAHRPPQEEHTRDRKAERDFYQAAWEPYVVVTQMAKAPVFSLQKEGTLETFTHQRTRFTRDAQKVYTLKVAPKQEHVHLLMWQFAREGHTNGRLEGTETFRRLGWLYGSYYGVAMEGYQPTAEDRGLLRYLERQSPKVMPVSEQGRVVSQGPSQQAQDVDPLHLEEDRDLPASHEPDRRDLLDRIEPYEGDHQPGAGPKRSFGQPERSEPDALAHVLDKASPDPGQAQQQGSTEPDPLEHFVTPDTVIADAPQPGERALHQNLERLRTLSPKGYQALGDLLRFGKYSRNELERRMGVHVQGEGATLVSALLRDPELNSKQLLYQMNHMKLHQARGRSR